MTKTGAKKSDFRPNDFVVYPAHGVGQIVRIEEQEVAGTHMELFVISFDKDKMTLRVPTAKANSRLCIASTEPRSKTPSEPASEPASEPTIS